MKLKFPLSVSFAIAFGLIVLLGYFLPQFLGFRQFFLQWAITLSAVALLIGLYNLITVHLDKLKRGSDQAAYSSVLMISAVATFLIVAVFGPTSVLGSWVFRNIQVPIETSLMAVLSVSLAYASVRLLRRKVNRFSLIFFATVLLVLLGTGAFITSQFPAIGNFFQNIRELIALYPATAGARGILLGVALGTIATGLRILMGVDRPYGG